MPLRSNDLSELSREFLRCRDEGHSWYNPSRNTTKNKRVGNHIERRSLCSCCGTRKMQLFTPGGKVVTFPKYEYPDGYLLKTGSQKVSRTEVRKITLRAVAAIVRRSA